MCTTVRIVPSWAHGPVITLTFLIFQHVRRDINGAHPPPREWQECTPLLRRGASLRAITEGFPFGYPIVHPFVAGRAEQLCAQRYNPGNTIEDQRCPRGSHPGIFSSLSPTASPTPLSSARIYRGDTTGYERCTWESGVYQEEDTRHIPGCTYPPWEQDV